MTTPNFRKVIRLMQNKHRFLKLKFKLILNSKTILLFKVNIFETLQLAHF